MDAQLAAAVVTSSPLATIVLDERRRVVGFNPAAEELTGRSAATLLGRPAAELFPADDARAAVADLEAAAEGVHHHLEMVLATGAGGAVRVGISWGALVVDGALRGLVGVGRDIARRKRLEHELRRYATTFTALAEDSDLGLYRFSFVPELRVDYVNPCLEELIGATFDELLVDPSPLWRRLDEATADALVRSRQGEPVPWPLDGTWQHPDGTVRELQFREATMRDVAGRLEAVVGTVRDVTAQRRQERAVAAALDLEREAAAELRRVDALRKVFLQAVSHELRTPLTAVLGFSATLRDRVADLPPERVRDLAARTNAQAHRLQRLLDDLLDVDRLTRGVLPLERRLVDVGALAREVAADVAPDAQVEAAPCPVVVDAGKIERVLSNLLVNARRHAGSDATVRLSVLPAEGDDPLRLVVEDDGPGVPVALREAVFEPFAQGRSAEGAPSPGTGIGLTLVRAFAELHGGEVVLDDSPLGGARFTVTVPAALGAPEPGPATPPPVGDPRPPSRDPAAAPRTRSTT